MKNRDENNIKKLYEAYPILKEIDAKDEIENNIIFKKLIAEEYLSTYGGSCLGFLFVIEGTIRIQKINEEGNETNLYKIKKGELCHEALNCFFNNRPLNILGKALQDSEICIMPFDILEKHILKNNKFLRYIYEDLYCKFQIVIENKEEIIHESLEKRLIKLLISKRTNIIYSTHSELAFELDSAREVVSRKLKSLEKRGYISLLRGKIQIIKDLNELIL